jgi:putative ABC transport system permease protein
VGMEFRIGVGEDRIQRLKIVGISSDYHYRSLHTDIEPQIIICDPNASHWAMLKINLDEYSSVAKKLEQHWNNYETSSPIDINFLKESIANMYEEDRQMRKIILFFTFIGLLISILGLIGLTSFTIEQKTKEIGMRKVVGAKLSDILMIISTDFMKWILISLLVSVPISYLLMANWLKQFPYRIDLHWWLLLLGGCIATAVALFTIGFQSNKAARANPVNSLRYD